MFIIRHAIQAIKSRNNVIIMLNGSGTSGTRSSSHSDTSSSGKGLTEVLVGVVVVVSQIVRQKVIWLSVQFSVF